MLSSGLPDLLDRVGAEVAEASFLEVSEYSLCRVELWGIGWQSAESYSSPERGDIGQHLP